MLPLISIDKHTYTEVYDSKYAPIDDIKSKGLNSGDDYVYTVFNTLEAYLIKKGLKPGIDFEEYDSWNLRCVEIYHPIGDLYDMVYDSLLHVEGIVWRTGKSL